MSRRRWFSDFVVVVVGRLQRLLHNRLHALNIVFVHLLQLLPRFLEHEDQSLLVLVQLMLVVFRAALSLFFMAILAAVARSLRRSRRKTNASPTFGSCILPHCFAGVAFDFLREANPVFRRGGDRRGDGKSQLF